VSPGDVERAIEGAVRALGVYTRSPARKKATATPT